MAQELAKHRAMLLARSGSRPRDFDRLMAALLSQITPVPRAAVAAKLPEAFAAIAAVDAADVPYLAAALAVGADAIWSEDRDFDAQSSCQERTTPTASNAEAFASLAFVLFRPTPL